MFFSFHTNIPPGAETHQAAQQATPQEEPEYMQGPEGELIINKKELLISSVISDEPVPPEELNKVSVLTGVGWVPYTTIRGQ